MTDVAQADARTGAAPPVSAPFFVHRHLPLLARTTAYLVSLLTLAPFVYHLSHGSSAYLGLLEDDYFYYAGVADQFVRFGRLTYDGVTTTNGFHPLWFAVLAVLRRVCGDFGPAFYLGLTTIALLALVATYEMGVRFARALGAGRTVAALAPAIYSLGTARLLSTGMECVAAVPLLLWFLGEAASPAAMTTRRAAWLGFLASLAVLARLDIALAVALLIAGYLLVARPALTTAMRHLAAFAAGGVLVPIYAAVNVAEFNAVLPVSAMAKRLYHGFGFNFVYARVVAFDTVYGISIGYLLPLGCLALYVLVRRTTRVAPAAAVVGGITLLFSLAFFALNALSGWIFFGWYAYPIAAAAIAAIVFIWTLAGDWLPRPSHRAAGALLLLATQIVLGVRYFREHGPGWTIADNSILAMSYDLAPRMQAHSGTFAMGAMAGMAAYVMHHPVVQIEGIMADRRMVEHLRRQDPLGDVLHEYGVDYLIVSLATRRASPVGGCYSISQPNPEWAGPRTNKMTGRICSEPVERFVTPHGPHRWSQFPAIETLVWDLRTARWAAGDR